MSDRPWIRTVDPNEKQVVRPVAAVVYLRGAEEEFERAMELCGKELRDVLELEVSVIPVEHGADLTAAAAWFAKGGVRRLVLLGHGSPTWFLRPERAGLQRWLDRGEMVISCRTFAKAWAPILLPGAIISLAACMCSRSPHWYLNKTYGRVVSPWGDESYLAGGEYSLAQSLVKRLYEEGADVVVRGHTAAGHCTDLAMIRSHMATQKKGRSLWALVTQGAKPPTLAEKKKWHQIVRGMYARHYLLGLRDEIVLQELRSVF